MSRIRYKPRLKKGILKGEKFLLIAKDLKKLRKFKWQAFLFRSRFINSFLRNDLIEINSQGFDHKKSYKYAVFSSQKFFAFFGSLKKKDLKIFLNLFVQNIKFKALVDSFIDFLEYRLDYVLVKANFAKTPFQSRWLINKGFIEINNKVVCSSGYFLKSGDLVRLKTKQCKNSFFCKTVFNVPKPNLEICYESFCFMIVKNSKFFNYQYPFFFDLEELVNFYRRGV